MEPRACLQGPGYFQWNAGGWLGSQLGGTLWLLAGAAVFAAPAPPVALAWLGCFAAANAAGWWLWRRRDRVRPYPALQGLLLACGACGLAAVAALHLAGPAGAPLAGDPRGYLALLAFPALMARFSRLEHAARAAPGPGEPGRPGGAAGQPND
jgi:hypothetical protein